MYEVVSRSVTPLTCCVPFTSVPLICSTTALVRNSIFSSCRARSSMTSLARKCSERCTIVTLSANFVRKVASSIAESPPPTTTSCFCLKKKPSHVAHHETPWPDSGSSPAMPSLR